MNASGRTLPSEVLSSGSPRRPTSRESSKAEGSTSMPPKPAADRPSPSSRHASEAAAPAAGPAAATSSSVCLQCVTTGNSACLRCITIDDHACLQCKVADDGMCLQCTPSKALEGRCGHLQPLESQQCRASSLTTASRGISEMHKSLACRRHEIVQ